MSLREKIETFLIRFRIPLSLLIFGLFLYEDWNENIVPRRIFTSSDALGILASALVVMGTLLRTWAAGTIHKTKKLATSGSYALARHPLYLGSFLIAMGFSLFLWDNENIWAVIFVALLLYLPKIRQEEVHMGKLFGEEWLQYCRRTAMFFPKSFPKLKSGWSFRQWNHNHEYETFAVVLVALAVMKISQQMFGN